MFALRRAGLLLFVASPLALAAPADAQVRSAPRSGAAAAQRTSPSSAPVARTAQATARPASKSTAPREPFVLTPEQQAAVDDALETWESKSRQVQTFKCNFDYWEYDMTLKSKTQNPDGQKAEGEGQIKFKSPDMGFYQEATRKEFVAPAKPGEQARLVSVKEGLAHWVCDGQYTYEFKPTERQVVRTKLAPEFRGKAISDGPLPFVFGTKAAALKQRYFIREVTPADSAKRQVWLEILPRYQKDAQNFIHCQVILNRADYMPYAMQFVQPGGQQRRSYQFKNLSINSAWANLTGDFAAPKTPFGWKLIDGATVPTDSGAPPARPAAANQARRSTAGDATPRR